MNRRHESYRIASVVCPGRGLWASRAVTRTLRAIRIGPYRLPQTGHGCLQGESGPKKQFHMAPGLERVRSTDVIGRALWHGAWARGPRPQARARGPGLGLGPRARRPGPEARPGGPGPGSGAPSPGAQITLDRARCIPGAPIPTNRQHNPEMLNDTCAWTPNIYIQV